MANTKHFRHSAHHFVFSYPESIEQRFYSLILMPIIAIVVIFIFFYLFSGTQYAHVRNLTIADFGIGVIFTFIRLTIAYFLALIVAIPVALLIGKSPIMERILFPLFDIVQSVPVLAFFPVVIWIFIRINFFDGAAIFLLFIAMLWNIVFSMIGGLKVVPTDIKSAAHVFHLRGFIYISRVLIPSVVPHIITGSILAWAQGWNIIIVAEVLHNYLPNGNASQDLAGIGSILVHAASAGQNDVLVAALIAMVIVIAMLNFFVWQKLLHYAEKFKFD